MSLDPFTLLGFDPSFKMDLEVLDHRYQECQLKFHPDRLALASPEEKKEGEAQALAVTQAYEALRYPISRLNTIFAILNLNAKDEMAQDSELLEEMMDVKEAIAECIGSTPNPERLETIRNIVEERVEDCQDTFEDLFGEIFSEGKEIARVLVNPDCQEGKTVREILLTLYQEFLYWQKTLDEIDAVE